MTRTLFALAVLFALAPAARAQDMPLSQILIDGEDWMHAGRMVRLTARPSVVATSPDGSTTFRWVSGRFVEARQTNAKEGVPYAPYCPLRVKKGEAPSVTAKTTDRDGRIYAATPLGVQVYDPTGRLCGVVHPPAPGKIDELGFLGDRLVAWNGDQRYVRKLNTAGVK